MSYSQELLATALECGASDIHIMQGSPPLLRIHTVLQETDYGVVTAEGLTTLREKLPFADVDKFAADPQVENLPDLFTVQMIVKYIEKKLAS